MADNTNTLNPTPHISKKYNADLEALREEVLTMGGMVEEQLKDSLNSLVNGDIELAKIVIKKDKDVNQKELDIDHRCAETVALRQPTAGDLRLILTVMKSIADLERIGDMAHHLASMGKKLADKGYSMRYFSDIETVGLEVTKMLTTTLNAFARLNPEEALNAMAMVRPINRKSRALSRQLATYMMEDPRMIKKTLRVRDAVRALERVGDHCENICENTIYLVRGEDIRYRSFDDVKERLLDESESD